MSIQELTDLLASSSEDFNQSSFIPWWVEDYEKFTYRYHIMDDATVREANACLAECGKEDLLAPAGKLGLTLFHLLVWHNFYDAAQKMLCDGRIEGTEADTPDQGGHGITPLMLACARGNLAMVRLLLEHGAKDSLCDARGMNPYHFLAYPRFEELDNDSEVLERSVEQRGEIARLLTCDINQKNASGLTPLEQLLSTTYSSSYTWPLTEIFLEKGASADYVDEEGNTLLMMARRNGHDTAALQLMKHCPGLLNVPNGAGVTPIRHAVNFCNQAMYLALLDHGAEPVPDNDFELFPLSQITCNAFGYPDNKDSLSIGLYMAEKLIRQTDPDDDDEVSELKSVLASALRSDEKARVLGIFKDAGFDFTSPFYCYGDPTCLRDECLNTGQGINVIRKLIALGVDMDLAVACGRTPANILASGDRHGTEDELFLQDAAELLSRESMEQTNDGGQNAVHLAARNGHTLMLKVMIEKGADLNLTEDAPAEAGLTPLHEACAKGHADAVKLLMASGADDTMKNLKGETPAHLAVTKDRWGRAPETEQTAEILKALKNLDLPRDDGRTPLMLLQDKALLPLFLEKGADVNHRDDTGMTPLILLHRDKDMAKILLEAGADINLTDNEGNTALHHALMDDAEAVARYLIKKGADYRRPNNQGETPAQLAVEHCCESVLQLMTDL